MQSELTGSLKGLVGVFLRRSIENKEKLSTKLLLRQQYFSWRIFWRSVLKPNLDCIPIFLVSSPRTGSSLISGYLNHHPAITDCGEVLNQRIARGLNHRKIGPKPVLGHIERTILASNSSYCLLKIHFNHLIDRETLLEDVLKKFPNSLVIFLYRKAILEQYCSQVIASNTREFVNQGKNSSEVFYLSLSDWEKYREFHIQTYRSALDILKKTKNEYNDIKLEDFIADPEAVLNQDLLPSLGLEQMHIPSPPLKKQEKRPLSEIILNFDEIVEDVQFETEITGLDLDS